MIKRSMELRKALQKAYGRQPIYREPGLMDVSASWIARFCPREEALAFEYGHMRKRVNGPSLQYLFDVGQAWHDAIQNYMLGPLGLVLGVWICSECLERHGAYPHERVIMPAQCSNCKTPQRAERGFNFRYWEDHLMDPATGATCHPDGYDPDALLWEFKSVGVRDEMEVKTRPKKEHVAQVQFNLLLQRLVRNNPTPAARIVYFGKAASGITTALSEFKVGYDEAVAMKFYNRVRELVRYRWVGTMPARICASATDERAVDCPRKKECFR